MKVSKKTGKVRLDANEVRVGNFFIRRDENEMKLTDLNGVFHHSVNRRMPIGIWLENIWARAYNGEESALNSLKTYVATMWSFFSVAPDDDFIKDALKAAKDALGRHPDWYGVKTDATEEEDAQAANEFKEMKEFEEDIKNLDKDGEQVQNGE